MRVHSPVPLSFYLYRFIGVGFFALVNLTLINNFKCRDSEFVLSTTLSDMSEPIVVDQDRIENIISKFKRHGVLPDEVELLEHKSSTYPDSRLHGDAYELLQRDSGRSIRMIGDIDFAVWAGDISRRWLQHGVRHA
jgi:hypothetical protein